MAIANDATRAARVRIWVCRSVWLMCPLGVWLVAGCNPASLAFLAMPFADQKEPAKCKLSAPKKDVNVAIVTWFGNRDLQHNTDVAVADNELSEKLAVYLREKLTANKEKVRIIPNGQVRGYQNKVVSDTWSPADIGKRVKADKVIALEINNLSLYEKNSYQQLFRGATEIAVKVYDLEKPDGEQVVFEEFYRTTFPKERPLDAGGSAQQFRASFIGRVARDLSKLFAAYDSQDRMYSNLDTDF